MNGRGLHARGATPGMVRRKAGRNVERNEIKVETFRRLWQKGEVKKRREKHKRARQRRRGVEERREKNPEKGESWRARGGHEKRHQTGDRRRPA